MQCLGVPVATDADTIETDRLDLRRWRESDAARPYDIQSWVPRLSRRARRRDPAQGPAHAEHGEVEIGWWLHPDSHGRGYATEGAGAVLDHAFAGGLTEVWAVMFPANAPSRGVMSRLGMTDLGVHERWYPASPR